MFSSKSFMVSGLTSVRITLYGNRFFVDVTVFQSLGRIRLFATHGLQHARLPRPSLSLRFCLISCPLSQ